MKLYLDPGHGGSDPGARGNGMAEKDIVLDIALRIRDILTSGYNRVEVKMSRTGDKSVSLEERTNEANSWGADYFLSIHCNAFNGQVQGYEDYIHDSLSDSSQTAIYQNVMHEEIIAVNRLTDRGQKKANFHVLRESVMSALLTENGFIDNEHDAALISDPSWRQTVAQGHVNGLARAFNLERKNEEKALYKVIAGSFQSKDNAEERVAYLQSKDISAFDYTTTLSGNRWYRVQAGAFSSRKNAETRLKKVRKAGIKDAFILTEGDTGGESGPKGYAISGATFLSPELMNQYVNKMNADAIELGIYYLKFGADYGIRGDIAFAQAMHETDFLKFTGIVQPEQNNFCGLGATGPDNPGASFDTPRDGVLAHIQHLYAYATTKSLPDKHPLVDPRFDLVTRGSAGSWVELNGKWAVPGNHYGQSILSLYERIIEFSMKNLEEIRKNISA
ncbi:N-acetylmuramoyl-L-alanine amidase [Virgibacillus ihumii]|uniref:N-acetylmuramoyl-L-alanine amidase n=1 Tax=Virgibacillus ihumii TaxID=2686091 RepID=UPI00157CAFC4|nr:N-acetylmuramoyl-L-alanine amidase [Virgibacillus ihumii]